MRIMRCDWGWGGGGEKRRKRREGDRQFNSGCDSGGGGEMYGAQPAEQWKTVVQTNDPQPDRYGPHRKDGHKAQFPGNQFPGSA